MIIFRFSILGLLCFAASGCSPVFPLHAKVVSRGEVVFWLNPAEMSDFRPCFTSVGLRRQKDNGSYEDEVWEAENYSDNAGCFAKIDTSHVPPEFRIRGSIAALRPGKYAAIATAGAAYGSADLIVQ